MNLNFSRMLAPICLFTYNRLAETKQTIEALQKNFLASESELFIFSDGGEDKESIIKVNTVRAYLQCINGFKKVEIFHSNTNKGLADSVIDGVTKIVEEYGKVIVLEDDLKTSPNFLDYMNLCLEKYEFENIIISISGHSNLKNLANSYNYDVAFGLRASSWGWATWKDRWEKVDWEVKTYNSFKFNLLKRIKFNRGGSDLSHMLDKQMKGKINSWAVRFCFHQFNKNMFDVIPFVTKVQNVGFGDDAQNCDLEILNDELDNSNNNSFKLPDLIESDRNILKEFRNTFNYKIRISRTIKRILSKISS